jgi:hypothetical protein
MHPVPPFKKYLPVRIRRKSELDGSIVEKPCYQLRLVSANLAGIVSGKPSRIGEAATAASDFAKALIGCNSEGVSGRRCRLCSVVSAP